MNQQPTNCYAAILAGGSGTRMGNPEKPKQFYLLGGKPILAHTVEKFCVMGAFDKVLVMSPESWLQQTRDILARQCPHFSDLIEVVAGGSTRNGTISNALSFIQENCPVDDGTVIVTHDAVRPFVTHRIISDNIVAAREYGACDTVIPATDTIVESLDGQHISAVPPRSNLYQGQTPQSFRVRELAGLIAGISADEAASLTDACKIYVLRGKPVALVDGEVSNMKITYPQDMRVAESLVGE